MSNKPIPSMYGLGLQYGILTYILVDLYGECRVIRYTSPMDPSWEPIHWKKTSNTLFRTWNNSCMAWTIFVKIEVAQDGKLEAPRFFWEIHEAVGDGKLCESARLIVIPIRPITPPEKVFFTPKTHTLNTFSSRYLDWMSRVCFKRKKTDSYKT